MSNKEHLARFSEGPGAWNAWRQDNPGITPDLRYFAPSPDEKRLGPADGGPIELQDALLDEAELNGATLVSAHLANADLRRANLSEAVLIEADLCFSNLSDAVLDGADLENADLRGAILDGAKLDLAQNLTQAQLEAAHGDIHTLLPPELAMPEAWQIAFEAEWDALSAELDEESPPVKPHVVLGLPPKPSLQEVRTAFRTLAKKYHPDLNPGDASAERRFMEISEAYRLLKKPPKPRAKRPKRETGMSWAAALALLLMAFGLPSLAVYWLGLPSFITKQSNMPEIAQGGMEITLPGVMSAQVDLPVLEPDKPAIMPQPPMAASVLAEGDAATSDAPAATPDAPASVPAAGPEPVAVTANASDAAPDEAERIQTSADMKVTTPAAAPDAPSDAGPQAGATAMAAEGDKDTATTGAVAPPAAPEGQPAEQRVASLQPPSPEASETAAPWDEEWAELQDSTELAALHRFINRYPDQAPAENARTRFRTLVAGISDIGVLRNFVGETVDDSPETMLAKRQLARLVERESEEMEEKDWGATQRTATIAAFRAYILNYPEGKHLSEAEEKLAALEEEAAGVRKDKKAWSKARRAGTAEAVAAYIKSYPKGRYLDDAKRKLAALNASEAKRRQEEDAWARARKADDPKGYYAYLNAYPNGRYANLAQQNIEKAERAATQTPRPRAASQEPKPRRGDGLRWPSSDEPFVEHTARPN